MWQRVVLFLIFSSSSLARQISFQIKSPIRSYDHRSESNLGNNLIKPQQRSDRIFTGISLATLTTAAIFAKPEIFPATLALASTLAQKEFSHLLAKKKIPTNSNFLTFSTFLSYVLAATFPTLHASLFGPLVFMMMTYFLIFKSQLSSTSEIGCTLLGLTLISYFPSYWVRLRNLGHLVPLQLPPGLVKYLPSLVVPQGAILLWLTWASLAFSDVGAYIVGKLIGSHKLSQYLRSSLGKSSPNKTFEGLVGGMVASGSFWYFVSRKYQYPAWYGGALGVIISLIGFIGDVSISLLKRDAGVKDSGALLGGHGGVLDRMDSYLLSAPLAFLFWQFALPFINSAKVNLNL